MDVSHIHQLVIVACGQDEEKILLLADHFFHLTNKQDESGVIGLEALVEALGYQHEPSLFFQYFPYLIEALLLDNQQQQQNNHIIDNKSDESILISEIIQVLIYCFSCYPQISDIVNNIILLNGYVILSKPIIINILKKYRWFIEDSSSSEWIEGTWYCKEAEGYLNWVMNDNIIGRRIKGTYHPYNIKHIDNIDIYIGKEGYYYSGDNCYIEGKILYTRQHELFFKGNNCGLWLHEKDFMMKIHAPLNDEYYIGSQILVKKKKEDRDYHRGIIKRTAYDNNNNLIVEVTTDDNITSAYLSSSIRFYEINKMSFYHKRHYDEGILDGILYIDNNNNNHNHNIIRMNGTWNNLSTYFRGLYDIEFSSCCNIFQGAFSMSDNDSGVWIGMKQILTNIIQFSPLLLNHNNQDNNQDNNNNMNIIKDNICSVINLDGKGDYIDLGISSSLNIYGIQPFTIECYIYMNEYSTNDDNIIISRYDNELNEGSYIIGISNNNNKLYCLNIESEISVPIQCWVHIAVTYDGKYCTLYINHEKAGYGILSSLLSCTSNNDIHTIVGAQYNNIDNIYHNFFHGIIQELRIWNICHNIEHFLHYSNIRISNDCYGLIGYYPLRSIYNIIEDLTSYCNHGLLVHKNNSKHKYRMRIDNNENNTKITPWINDEKIQLPVTGHFHSKYIINNMETLVAGDINMFYGLNQQHNNNQHNNNISDKKQQEKQYCDENQAAMFSYKPIANIGEPFACIIKFKYTHLTSTTRIALQFQRTLPWLIQPYQCAQTGLSHIDLTYQTKNITSTFETFDIILSIKYIDEMTSQVHLDIIYNGISIISIAHLISIDKITDIGELQITCYKEKPRHVAKQKINHNNDNNYNNNNNNKNCKLRIKFAGQILLSCDRSEFFNNIDNNEGIYLGLFVAGKNSDALPVILDWRFQSEILNNNIINSNIYDYNIYINSYIRQLKEFEKWIKPSYQYNDWKRRRNIWLKKLDDYNNNNNNNKHKINDIILITHQLISCINCENDNFTKEDMAVWLKDLQNITNLADICNVLLDLEENIGYKCCFSPWQGRIKKKIDQRFMFRQTLKNIEKMIRLHLRIESANILKSQLDMPISFDSYIEALKINDDNDELAISWLLDRMDDLVLSYSSIDYKRTFLMNNNQKNNHQKNINNDIKKIINLKPVIVNNVIDHNSNQYHAMYDLYNNNMNNNNMNNNDNEIIAPITGYWMTSRGILSLNDFGPFMGKKGYCHYPQGNGYCDGYFSKNTTYNAWVFEGTWADNNYTSSYPCYFEFNECGDRFSGWWNNDDSKGEWKGMKTSILNMKLDQCGYAGLINLGNTCYQNSFLQALYMTGSLTKQLLSISLDNNNMNNESKEEEDDNNSKEIIKKLQWLYSTLKMSLRPSINQENLKISLKTPFHLNKQHDAMQYGQYILELLETGLKSTSLSSLSKDIFGGSIITALKCHSCNHIRSLAEEQMNNLVICFPDMCMPIKDIIIISGKSSNISPPESYDRININTNSGREKDGGYTYICVSRIGNKSPITDIRILYITNDDDNNNKNDELIDHEYPDWEIIKGNLNNNGKTNIYICIKRQLNGSPITQLTLLSSNNQNEQPPNGYDKLINDLNYDSGGYYVYLCVKRGGFVRDVQLVFAENYYQAMENKPDGFSILPTNINLLSLPTSANDIESKQRQIYRENNQPAGDEVYIAFTSGGNLPAVTDIISYETSSSKDNIDNHIDNDNKLISILYYYIGDVKMSLVISRGDGSPVQSLSMYRAPMIHPQYGGHVVVPLTPTHLFPNGINNIYTRAWCFDDGNYMFFHHEDNIHPLFDCYIVEGPYTKHKGWLNGIIYKISDAFPNEMDKWGDTFNNYMFEGSWRQSNYKFEQPCQFYFSTDFSTFNGSWQHGNNEGGWTGVKINDIIIDNNDNDMLLIQDGPITNIKMIQSGINSPKGYKRISTTHSNHTANLNANSNGIKEFLTISRDTNSSPIVDIIVLLSGIDELPYGYDYVRWYDTNEPANTNEDSDGHTLYIAYCTSDTNPDEKSYIYDINVIWSSIEKSFDTYNTIISTPCGVEADLNGGSSIEHEILLVYKKLNPIDISIKNNMKSYNHPIEGTWQTSSGTWTAKIQGKVTGKSIRGSWCGGREGWVQGVIFNMPPNNNNNNNQNNNNNDNSDNNNNNNNDNNEEGKDENDNFNNNNNGYQFIGRYGESSITKPGFVSYTFDKYITTLTGIYGFKGNGSYCNARKDNDVILVYEHSNRSLWKNGNEIISSVGSGNSILSMVEQHFQPELMIGNNKLLCVNCNTKTIIGRYPCIKKPPSHLILSSNQFSIDYTTLQTSKIMDNVDIEHIIQLPYNTNELMNQVVFNNSKDELNDIINNGLIYGLYGILVHSGSNLNSGHYFIYARDSESNLMDKDNMNSPWMCFNDTNVYNMKWDDIVHKLRSSISDTAYIFFYRRILSQEQKTKIYVPTTPSTRNNISSTIPRMCTASCVEDIVKDNKLFLQEMINLGSSNYLLERLLITYQQLDDENINITNILKNIYDENNDNNDNDILFPVLSDEFKQYIILECDICHFIGCKNDFDEHYINKEEKICIKNNNNKTTE